MASTLTIRRGTSRDFTFQAYNADGSAASGVFTSGDTLDTEVWRSADQAPVATPTTTWVSETAGTFKVSFINTDTEDMTDYSYMMVTTFTRSGRTGSLLDATLRVLPAPGLTITAGANGTIIQSSAVARLATVYCTDEDIALRAPNDFVTICPRWQQKAFGTDGVIDSTSPWVLTSTSVDFEAQGVKANDIVALTKPNATFKTPSGDLFAVDSVSDGSVTLRRPGGYLYEGQPPSKVSLTAVEFRIPTLRRQIDDACFNANRSYGIDPALPGRAPSLMYDPRDLQEYTILTVLKKMYAMSDGTRDSSVDIKLKLTITDLADVSSRLLVKWGTYGTSQAPTGPGRLRIGR